MKRTGIAVICAVVVSTALWSGTAASQETTTTTAAPTTTTSLVPATTTTTTAPPPTTAAPTTTAAPVTTTTIAPVTTTTLPEIPDIENFVGDSVTDGYMNLDIRWDNGEGTCVQTIDIGAGGDFNVGYDENGNLGAMYGLANTPGGNAAAVQVKIGPLPLAVTIVSVEDSTCSLDAVGFGNYESTATTSKFEGVGVGVGLVPGSYLTPSFADSFSLDTYVNGTSGTGYLDLEAALIFLDRERG